MKLNCIYTTLSLYKYVDVMHIHVGSIFMYILYNSQTKQKQNKNQKNQTIHIYWVDQTVN